METLDYLPNTNIYLYQRKDMFRINTDTHLLGNFMQVASNETVLDIGTNNGALLLYAAQMTDNTLYGVDIQADAIALAKKNMLHNNISNYKLYVADIKEIELPLVDVIVCNPPYFPVGEDSNINKQNSLRLARHELSLNLYDLITQVNRLLKEKGRFYLVHRAERLVEILSLLKERNLEAKQIKFVYDEDYPNAFTVLVEAIKGASSGCKVLPPQYIKR